MLVQKYGVANLLQINLPNSEGSDFYLESVPGKPYARYINSGSLRKISCLQSMAQAEKARETWTNLNDS